MRSNEGLINSYFFDSQRAQPYFLGVFIKGYRPVGDYGVMFESPSSQLIDMVRFHLQIPAAVSAEMILDENIKKPLYRMIIEDDAASQLNSKLGDMDLNVVEKERKFPDIISSREDVRDFSRGFLDASLPYLPKKSGIQYGEHLPVYYASVPFLKQLYAAWVDHGFIRDRKKVIGSPLLLDVEDRISLCIHLYQKNLKYLQQCRLYLPATMRLLRTTSAFSGGELDEKIIRIMEALMEGDQMKDIAVKEGYSNLTALSRYVKNKTDKSMTQLLKDYRLETARILLLQDVPVRLISIELGFRSGGAFSTFFKKETNKTPSQYRQECTSKT